MVVMIVSPIMVVMVMIDIEDQTPRQGNRSGRQKNKQNHRGRKSHGRNSSPRYKTHHCEICSRKKLALAGA
jgi:hypothetical protein